MSDITSCKVVNKYNENEVDELVVCTEWTDNTLTILIIKNDKTLQGEIAKEDFNKYAKAFYKSLEDYLQEIRDILSGKQEDIEFFLKDDKFYWKRKKLVLGQVIVKSLTETRFLTSFTTVLVNNFTILERESLAMRKNNEELTSMNSQLKKKLDEVIIMKSQLEDILYKKFTLLLNSKKNKIKELKRKIEQLENKNNCIFDVMTDESNSDSDYVNREKPHSSHKTIDNEKTNQKKNKKKVENQVKEEIPKKIKVSTVDEINQKKTTIDSEMCVDPVPSTSKSLNQSFELGEDEETPDILSGESECDFELKFDEDKSEDHNRSKTSAIIHQDSEEEMF